MNIYQCKNCDWRWQDSSFVASVKADGCPKCTSNIIERIELMEVNTISIDLNNHIKEMVIAYSRNDNIKYHPEAAINEVKQLIRDVLNNVTPTQHPGTSEFANGVNMTLVEIALRRKKLEVDLAVASGQKL